MKKILIISLLILLIPLATISADIYKVEEIGENIYGIKTYRTVKDPNDKDIQAPVDRDPYITVAVIQQKIDSLQARIDVWQAKLNAINEFKGLP